MTPVPSTSTISRPARAEPPVLCPSVVPATLGLAFSLAVSADALFRAGPAGAAFPGWVATTAGCLMVLAARADRAVSREAKGWLGIALVFSIGLAWRDSEMLQAFDFLVTAGALVLAAASLGGARGVLFAPRLRDTVHAALSSARSIAGGFALLVFRDAAARYDTHRWSTVARRAIRIGLLVGALTLVFGSLLTSADPIFASFVSLPNFDLSEFARHAIIVAVLAWVLGGWARGALIDAPESPISRHAPAWRLGTLEVTTIFVTLIVLFAAFVVAQLGWLFGGEAFLQARTGLTAAAYARQGFFQMVWVVTLVIPLLVATRSALAPGWALARRYSMLAIPVVVLLGAIVASAALRMRLYVRYYGLSIERVYPLVFMAWLAFILVWLCVTTLRGRPRRFGPGLVLSGLVTLAGLNIVVPDSVVARVNVARSTVDGAQPLDVHYLSTLSGEAVELTVPAILAAPSAAPPAASVSPATANPTSDYRVTRCSTVRRILSRWGAGSEARVRQAQLGAWRSWNAGEVYALRVVARYQTQLDAAASDACKGVDTTKPAQAPNVQR
jgi:Domain of unknown function (DUF4173)